MGMVFPLPLSPAAYPEATAFLEPPEQLVVRSLRLWVADRRWGADPWPALAELFDPAGVVDAGWSVDAWLSIAARTALRPIGIGCLRCQRLSADEAWCLYAAAAAQRGATETTEAALRVLLSGPGAAFAVGPVAGLAELFATAGLPLRRRLAPRPEAWQADRVLH